MKQTKKKKILVGVIMGSVSSFFMAMLFDATLKGFALLVMLAVPLCIW